MPLAAWISELDEHGHNFLIDELVYHLEGRRTVKAIEMRDKFYDEVGYNFVFSDGSDTFLKVPPEMIGDHWNEAKQIAQAFPMLLQMRFIEA